MGVKLFGDEFVVPFEPVVLDEMRTKVRRRRGPHVVPETLGLTLADLDAAVRRYCRDGAGIRGSEALPAGRF